jgi:hypothetical protein
MKIYQPRRVNIPYILLGVYISGYIILLLTLSKSQKKKDEGRLGIDKLSRDTHSFKTPRSCK